MPGAIIRGELQAIRIGRYCVIGEGTVIRPAYRQACVSSCPLPVLDRGPCFQYCCTGEQAMSIFEFELLLTGCRRHHDRPSKEWLKQYRFKFHNGDGNMPTGGVGCVFCSRKRGVFFLAACFRRCQCYSRAGFCVRKHSRAGFSCLDDVECGVLCGMLYTAPCCPSSGFVALRCWLSHFIRSLLPFVVCR